MLCLIKQVIYSYAATEEAYEFIASETHNLYGCKTWSRTLREECRLRVFENRVLRGIFDPKRDKVRGEWRKLHNEELNDLYSSPNVNQVKKSRMRCGTYGREQGCMQGFGGGT
jgi:hypothetical protein